MCCFVIARVGTRFQLQKMIKPENHLCISWSLWVSVLEVMHWGANNAFLAMLWIIASTAVGRRVSLWPSDPLRKDWCFQRLLPFPDAGGTNVASCNRQAVLIQLRWWLKPSCPLLIKTKSAPMASASPTRLLQSSSDWGLDWPSLKLKGI